MHIGNMALVAAGCALALGGCTKNESRKPPPSNPVRPATRAEEPRETTPAQDKKMANQASGIPQGKGDLFAIFQTSAGSITCRLLEQEAPETVANFVGLATGSKEWTDPRTGEKTRKPLYDGTVFHRVIPNFMIHGGGPPGT